MTRRKISRYQTELTHLSIYKYARLSIVTLRFKRDMNCDNDGFSAEDRTRTQCNSTGEHFDSASVTDLDALQLLNDDGRLLTASVNEDISCS